METLSKPRAGTRRNVLPDKTPKKEQPKSNGFDREQFLVWSGKLKKEEVAYKAVKKQRDMVRRLAKNSGMRMAAFDALMRDLEQDPDKVHEYYETYFQYREWAGEPSAQLELWNVSGSSILTHEERQKKAERSGYTHGCMGLDQDIQAYPPGHEFHQIYLEAYYKGQKVNTDRIKPIEMAIENEAAKNEKAPDKKEDPPPADTKDPEAPTAEAA